MFGKKITFIIPGFKHKPTSKAYKKIAGILKKEGHIVVPVTIPWRQSTISENIAFFMSQYRRALLLHGRKKTKREVYILGFSFGAIIAFVSSTKFPVSGLILCSLSPYFKEDLLKVKKNRNSLLDTSRYDDFSQLHCGRLTKKVKAKQISMLYGTNESRSLIERVTKTYDQILSPHKYLFPIKKTEHNIGDKR